MSNLIPSEYFNDDGFITVTPEEYPFPGPGNGWLQTGLAKACGMYPPTMLTIKETLKRCEHSPSVPLIYRTPHKRNKDDNQHHDDYYGAVLIDLSWARRLYEYGEKRNWFMDVRNPDENSVEYYFAKYWGFVPHIKLAAGIRLKTLEHAELFIRILHDCIANKGDSGNMKAFCRIYLARQYSWPLWLVSKLWIWRVRFKYGSVGKSWANYFGKDHPLVAYDE